MGPACERAVEVELHLRMDTTSSRSSTGAAAEHRVERLLVGSATPRWLVLTASLPCLAAAWLLLAPGVVFTREMTWDLLFNLAGAWHLQNGHVLHVDVHDPLGVLGFQLTRLGFRLVGLQPLAFLVGELIVAAWLFSASILAASHRLPRLPALLFVLYAVLLVLTPAVVGDLSKAYSFAMSYNRWGWSALATLFLILFVRPEREGRAWPDAMLGLLLILFMLYLKITFAVASVMGVAVALVIMDHVRAGWRAWGLVLAVLLVNALAPWNGPYFADLGQATVSGYGRSYAVGRMLPFLMNNRAEFGIYGIALLLLVWQWRRGTTTWSTPVAAAAIVGLGSFVLSQNAQAGNVPVGVVVTFLVYLTVCTGREGLRREALIDRVLVATAVLGWAMLSVSAQAVTLAGYVGAARDAPTTRIETTNLRGLAVPSDDAFLAGELARTGHQLLSSLHPSPQRSPVTASEYLKTLEAGAALFSDGQRGRVRILVLDQVNPFPFMLGYPPPRGGNLWLWPEDPVPAPERVFGEVDVVLIPKYSTDAASTVWALSTYRQYLAERYPVREETPAWSVLSRAPTPSEPMQIGRFEEQPALARIVGAAPEHPVAVDEVPPLDQRAVSDVDHRARPQLVGREEVGEDARARAVELGNAADEELPRELIGGAAVEDVQIVDRLTRRGPFEGDVPERQRLREPAAGLQRHRDVAVARAALERLIGVVEDRQPEPVLRLE